MSGSLRVPSDKDRGSRTDVQDDLDEELNKYSFTHHQQLLDDSPNKSELNQFNDFSGSHSQFDQSGSIERGMANLEKSTDFSFRSKSAMPPMSTISSLSSHTDSPRKSRSEGARRSSSINRFSPMSARKVTALGMHESESEYSPSKYYQPARTPHAASRLNPQSTRKVSPKSFKNTEELFNDLGLDDTLPNINTTTMPAGQSFRIPRNIPDLSTLLSSSRKTVHKAIDSVPVSEDNQKLFQALQELQLTVDGLEQENRLAQEQLRKAADAKRRAEENAKAEQQRANFAESELKKQLATNAAIPERNAQTKALEGRNATLLSALSTAKKDLENRTVELELAREEAAGIEEECNRVTERLANALENVKNLTSENEALKAQMLLLKDQLAVAKDTMEKPREHQNVDARVNERLSRHTPVPDTSKAAHKKLQRPLIEESYSDEGIEVSRSVLNDSEIEELTQEIEETRRRNKAKQSRTSSKPASTSRTASNPKTETKPARQSARRKSVSNERPRVQVESRKLKSKAKKQIPVLDDSEADTFASYEDNGQESEYESQGSRSTDDDDDLGFVSTAEDEPSRILYRRKPVQQSRGKGSGASKVNVQQVISELSRHDIAKCTICSRKSAAKKTKRQAQQTQRKTSGLRNASDDPEATIRPSQPPLPALHSVLAGLEDEFRHLKIKYHSQADDYNKLDPSLGRKKRKALVQDLRSTIEALEGKADQIYSVFDVLEAAATGMPLDYEEPTSVPKTTNRREWINV